MRLPSEGDAVAVETLIDQIGLYEVLSLVTAICAAKAHHVSESYSDNHLARDWTRAGQVISEVADTDPVGRVSPE